MNQHLLWPEKPMEIVEAFEARGTNRGKVGALVVWATWNVESIGYLSDLETNRGQYAITNAHDAHVIDIAHARWAASTAITALDLCAAALARFYGSSSNDYDADLRNLKQNKFRNSLSAAAIKWADDVLSDERYNTLLEIRNPLIHARLKRIVYTDRATEFVDKTGNAWTARSLIDHSKLVSYEHTCKFLNLLKVI